MLFKKQRPLSCYISNLIQTVLFLVTVSVVGPSYAQNKVIVVPLGSDNSVATYAIGGAGPADGIVFHVSADRQHGLEAARSDQSTGIKWYNGSFIITNAARNGVFGGRFNTDRIITIQGVGSYAALLCADYSGSGYGDWYLPSKDELNLMYTNLHLAGLGGYANEYYWSSTETIDYYAWSQNFGDGLQVIFNKDGALRVRAVRAF